MSTETRVSEYLNESEEVSYALSHRPTGIVNWVKSLFGFGKTYWHVTNQRVLEYQKVGGGFRVQSIPLEKVASVEYGRKLNLILLGAGLLLGLVGLLAIVGGSPAGLLILLVGGGLAAYALLRKQQVLAVHGSGGVSLLLNISKGENVDEFLWYVNAERQKGE